MNRAAHKIVIIGAGPAGLMAAQTLAQAGVSVVIYDAMPSVARKFLQAGKGGLNLTHSEPMRAFVGRYGEAATQVSAWLTAFSPKALREWAVDLGFETFVGSSGRVFPVDMKAAPLLRAWIHRLKSLGVVFHVKHRWLGWNEAGALRFATPEGELCVRAEKTLLALGGASWKRLGSDGAWASLLAQQGVPIAPFKPSNGGVQVAWSEYFKTKYAGAPLKNVALNGVQGEMLIDPRGLEGSLIYAQFVALREAMLAQGSVTIHLDLLPQVSLEKLQTQLQKPQGKQSFSSYLTKVTGLDALKVSLLHECVGAQGLRQAHSGHRHRLEAHDSAQTNAPASLAGHSAFEASPSLAQRIKACPVKLCGLGDLDDAISTAGGVALDALAPSLELKALPNVYCIGEMLDWEAPTGGYLLTASMASGVWAAKAILAKN